MSKAWPHSILAWLCFLAGGLAAEPRTKAFPDEFCKYTLPSDDWQWQPTGHLPNAGGQTIFLAKESKGATIVLTVTRLEKDHHVGAGSYESYESGMFQASKVSKKRPGSRHLEFRGVPSYQIEAETLLISRSSIRLMFANQRLYSMMCAYPAGREDFDPESVFQGFDFTEPPKLMVSNSIADSAARGKQAAGAFDLLIVIGLLVGLIIIVVNHNKKPKPSA